MQDIRAFTPEQLPRQEMLEANLVVIAIGPTLLKNAAPLVRDIIAARNDAGIVSGLTVIACENMDNGSSTLYRYVELFVSQL